MDKTKSEIRISMNKFVAMDIDGVLADFEGFLVEYLKDVHPEYAQVNRDIYDLKHRYPSDVYEDVSRFVADPNAYYAVPRANDGFQFLNELSDEGVDVLLVTSRPIASETFTKRWVAKQMKEWGMNYNDLRGVSFAPNKSAFLFPMREHIAFLVDDNPEDVLEAQKFGLTAYSWVQPWNEHVYPKVFVTRDEYTMFQKDESTEARYFWEKEIE